MQTNRLFDIIYILLNQERITAKALSARCEVSIRTIYRDIDRLSQAGIPIYTQKGAGGGVGLLSDFVLNKVLLDQKERETVLQALETMAAVNIETTNVDVLQKLSAFFGKISEPWLAIDLSTWYETSDQCFDLLKRAIFDTKSVRFNYFNSKGDISTREVEPMQLVFKSMNWYLKGYCLTKSDFRLFKLSRMTSLIISSQQFTRREMVTTTRPFVDSREIETVHLVMEVAAAVGYRVYDDFPVDSISKLASGHLLVDGEFPKGKWLISYILSLGEAAKVISPTSLKKELVEKVESMRPLYQEQTND